MPVYSNINFLKLYFHILCFLSACCKAERTRVFNIPLLVNEDRTAQGQPVLSVKVVCTLAGHVIGPGFNIM